MRYELHACRQAHSRNLSGGPDSGPSLGCARVLRATRKLDGHRSRSLRLVREAFSVVQGSTQHPFFTGTAIHLSCRLVRSGWLQLQPVRTKLSRLGRHWASSFIPRFLRANSNVG